VHRDHPGAESRGGFHGTGHLVWDVVELQIEKHAMALVHSRRDQRGSLCGKELAAHLQPSHQASEAGGHLDGLDGVVYVQRD
jgi:hypothetical protein